MNLYKGYGLIFGNYPQLDKRYILLISVLIVALFVGYKSYSPELKKHVKMVITQNSKSIKRIDQKRSIKNRKIMIIDKIYFPSSTKELIHYKLGKMGYFYNFFCDFYANFDLKIDERVGFEVKSDDGFRLYVDGKLVAKHLKDRPMESTKTYIKLKKGTHKIKLEYFQGGGHLGVEAYYKIGNSRYFIGEDSKVVTFKSFKK
jgi:hypothetical protein